mmetsp:Transcript_29003/g.38656  ORF Transcript_29003/g.38656 Transcript_29003/m.38656 type:complete len:94 (-) Transcript_29003:34-315(-)
MLKRDLTDEEQLLQTFGDGSQTSDKKDAEGQEEGEEDKVMDLEMKKNFYYVISPAGEIVDCAKIYSFLHEDNIFKRITARICKHVDSKINAGD